MKKMERKKKTGIETRQEHGTGIKNEMDSADGTDNTFRDTGENETKKLISNKKTDKVNLISASTLIKRLRAATAVIVLLAVTASAFAGLYFNHKRAVYESDYSTYVSSLSNALRLMERCMQEEFDYEARYREITAELGVAADAIYRLEETGENREIVSNTYYAFIRYPGQTKKYMADIAAGIKLICTGNPVGFEYLNDAYARMDKYDVQ